MRSNVSPETSHIHEMYCNVHFMNETNFDWDDLRLFLAVARQGGLAAASASTGKSAPTLGRRMLALERRLGQELFERLPRGYVLTDQGRELLVRTADLADQIAPIERTADGSQAPLVKVSAGTWVTQHLCLNIKEIVANDDVALRFIAAEHVLDIARREAVIGIRNHRPEQIGLAGRQIGRVQFATYARDKDVTTWIRVAGSTPSARWVEANVSPNSSIEVTSPRNALDLVQAGAGKAVLPVFIGAACADLFQISSTIDELEHEQWLVTHHEDRFLPEVRRTINRVHSILKQAAT